MHSIILTILVALVGFAQFDPSPIVGPVHLCTTYMRSMVPGVCEDPTETNPCMVMSPMIQVACEIVDDEAFTVAEPAPGQLLAFCIYTANPIDLTIRSDCAEPVNP